MKEYTETTAQNLRFLRGARGLNQEAIAQILGLPGNAISKIEKGIRALATSEKSLLDLYFFGIFPFELVSEKLTRGILDFSEDQWRVIVILAKREGITPGAWIGNKIRDYLAWDEKARAESEKIHGSQSPPFEVLRVAQDEAPYQIHQGKP